MRLSAQTQQDVKAELAWSPEVNDADIAVTVDDKVVTLTGSVGNLAEKCAAERAAKRVLGVIGIANELKVRVPEPATQDDAAIAKAAVAALGMNLPILVGRITVLVSDGVLTLEGQLEWNYERERAEEAVRHLQGVRVLNNQIRVEPRVQPLEIKRRIEDAFRRSAELEAATIMVTAEGRTVRLEGNVRTWNERLQAQQTAWSAPGVEHVQNNLHIRS